MILATPKPGSLLNNKDLAWCSEPGSDLPTQLSTPRTLQAVHCSGLKHGVQPVSET